MLVAATIWFFGNNIVRVIHAANMDRRADHLKMMEVLDVLPDELSSIRMHLDSIEQNTRDPSDLLD
ncbi:hypothetical protein H9L12_08310 [Sphingomonas rhizophila]|uniref:Uncharacterized protein n=1 Tax=Sphingomonas rhizophila TaxID=2071607 RepID=A0A7G9S909_9SPHN|nr:hypothetical protein [Sphingomonas rhizophila]QNN64334.1 hypothetical protein H9L12_08310 [Sphingomonas rhizophila]